MNDSIDKIVKYFSACTTVPFTYKKRQILPKELIVSPLLFRGFKCPENCGACCPVFSLDYLPEEPRPEIAIPREIHLNETKKRIWSVLQTENQNHHCLFVDMKNARCLNHPKRPFSCDFELVRFLQYKNHFRLTQQPFGRAWALTKVDGSEGAACIIDSSPSKEASEDALRKLNRLRDWMIYFGLPVDRIDAIFKYKHQLYRGRALVFETKPGPPQLLTGEEE